jgi:hypothetical protein
MDSVSPIARTTTSASEAAFFASAMSWRFSSSVASTGCSSFQLRKALRESFFTRTQPWE